MATKPIAISFKGTNPKIVDFGKPLSKKKPKSEVIRRPTFKAWRSSGFDMNEKQVLEWCAAFLFMFHDPVKEADWWYMYCTHEACKYQDGSASDKYAFTFWWSLRYYGDENDWQKWRDYLQFKLGQ